MGVRLASLLRKPAGVRGSRQFQGWFARVAEELLKRTELVAGGEAHRLLEIEFYYYGDEHLDPFSHRQPISQRAGLWYFHRTGNSYRGGSFKGADITFGHRGAFAGILIRTLQTSSGRVIDGPSLCVDHLLKLTGYRSVTDLDGAIGGQKAWDEDSPLRIRDAVVSHDWHIYSSPRVGLTLNIQRQQNERRDYISRAYRFLTEPRLIKKGKRQMVLGLHHQGHSQIEIARLTGCPRIAVERYIREFQTHRRHGVAHCAE
jgi:hypothetical protein